VGLSHGPLVVSVAFAKQRHHKARVSENVSGHSPWLANTVSCAQLGRTVIRQPIRRDRRMALNEAMRCRRRRGASWSGSRTTSDFEIFRPRDSSSMSATSGSGNRTVRVFMGSVYYISGKHAIQPLREPSRSGLFRAQA
jgi:hypothetical protein